MKTNPEFKETQRISLKAYCPNRRLPLSMREIFMQQVQWEDKINHSGEPVPELPKFEKVKVVRDSKGWLNFYKDLLLKSVRQLAP